MVKDFYRYMLKAVRDFVAEREVTAQEAALDAHGLPLIRYSCDSIYVQARPPGETFHTVKRTSDRRKSRRLDTSGEENVARKLSDFVYDVAVTKYVKRKRTRVD